MFAELVDLVLPSLCVCCRQPSGAQWCPDCRAPAEVRVCVWPGAGAPGIEVWAAAEYAGGVRQALLAYKERGQRRLARPLAQLLAASVRAASGPDPRAPVLIVPVPSVAAAARERGGDHMLRLAGALAALQGPSASGLEVAPVLRSAGRALDSVGLSAAQRGARQHQLTVTAPTARQARAEVVLVDDIATTGLTLAESARVLAACGWQVRGAAVVAHTRRRTG